MSRVGLSRVYLSRVGYGTSSVQSRQYDYFEQSFRATLIYQLYLYSKLLNPNLKWFNHKKCLLFHIMFGRLIYFLQRE